MVCDATAKTCGVVGKLGDDCSMAGTGGSCVDGLYCDGTTMKCATLLALGAACTPPPLDAMMNPLGGDPCHDGSCDPTAKTCTNVCR